MLQPALILLSVLLLTGCSKDEPTPPVKSVSRTVLVYMIADNDLGLRSLDSKDIAEMKEGMRSITGLSGDYRLIEYHAPYQSNPILKEISPDGSEKILASYTDSEAENSVSVSRMNSVISTVKEMSPTESYGLVLWSHGTGWLEDGKRMPGNDSGATTLSYGSQNGYTMTMPELARGLSGNYFDFIYFDCCLMATVEVAYELRHNAGEIVASATELPLEGMPYDKNVPCFFDQQQGMKQAAKNTYDYYLSDAASFNSCTISVINTDGLTELASATRAILATGAVPSDSYVPVPFFRKSVVPAGAYDMAHYIRALSAPQALADAWEKAFASTVTTAYATPTSYYLDMTNHNGLGTNIVTATGLISQSWGYMNLQWYKDVVSYHPILAN